MQRSKYLFRALLLLLPLVIAACSSGGQDGGLRGLAAVPTADNVEVVPANATHFVEFRAVMAVFPGHSYFVHGRLDRTGSVVEQSDPIGFYPFLGPLGGSTLGLLAIPGSTAPDPVDLQSPVVEQFRVNLTPSEYGSLMRFVRQRRQNTAMWNLILNNCNDFVADAARAVGLNVPSGPSVTPPYAHIRRLREMNANLVAGTSPGSNTGRPTDRANERTHLHRS